MSENSPPSPRANEPYISAETSLSSRSQASRSFRIIDSCWSMRPPYGCEACSGERAGTRERRRCAAGLRRDLDAVRAGLTEQCSSGPVEGFVHKLKALKRQGYGRAGGDLPQARVLAA
jgi:hypothetical protein